MTPPVAESSSLCMITVVMRECSKCQHTWKPRAGQLNECPKCRTDQVKTIKAKVQGRKCLRCGHEWVPMDATRQLHVCPKCHSPWWDRPRRVRKSARLKAEREVPS